MLKYLSPPLNTILPVDIQGVIHLLAFVGVVEELIFYHWWAHGEFRGWLKFGFSYTAEEDMFKNMSL